MIGIPLAISWKYHQSHQCRFFKDIMIDEFVQVLNETNYTGGVTLKYHDYNITQIIMLPRR